MIPSNFEVYFKRKEKEYKTRIDIARKIFENIMHLRTTPPQSDRISILNQHPSARRVIEELDIVKKLERLKEYVWSRYQIERTGGSISELYCVTTYINFIKEDLENRNMQLDFYRFIMETPEKELLAKILEKGEWGGLDAEAWIRQRVSREKRQPFKQFLKEEIKSETRPHIRVDLEVMIRGTK